MPGQSGRRGNKEQEGGKGHGSPSERQLEFGGRKLARGREDDERECQCGARAVF